MEIFGYKCFNKDLTNNYGKKFSVGKIYITSGAIKFGNNGNGFHICKNMEDTFRYYDTSNIIVCEVIGSGNYVECFDEYNEYFDMYSVEKLEIIKELSREEIIKEGLDLNEIRVKRFLSTFKLNDEELLLFKNKYRNKKEIINLIAYYQEYNKEIFNEKVKVNSIDKKI